MWRPASDLCRASSGALGAGRPVMVLWALGAELALTAPSAPPPGPHWPRGAHAGAAAPLLPGPCCSASPRHGGRGRAIWTFACGGLCLASSLVGGPKAAHARPWLGPRGHFPAACFQWRTLGQRRAGASPGSLGVNGRGRGAGSGRPPAHAGPTQPRPGRSRVEEGPYSPPRLQGHRFPFHVERKLTACLQEQLGFVPSAVLGACSRLDNPGCVPGDQEPTEAPWPWPRSHGGLRWGPREPLLQGPRFLSAPETEMALPRQRSPGSSGRGAAGCGGSGGGPSFVTGLLVPGGHESRCKQLCGGSPFSRLPRAHPRGFQALPSLCCRRKGGWETASPGGVPAGASGRQKTRQPAPPPCVGRGSPGS